MEIRAAAEGRVEAPASRVYSYIADFREHHPKFLPPQFSDLVVEQGGYGAGTVHSFTLELGGRRRRATVRVYEPEPGRVLTEIEPLSGMVTRFTVEPDGRGATKVRIETTYQARGIGGLVERAVVPGMLRRLYRRELELLAEYAVTEAITQPRVMRTVGGALIG